MEYVTEIIALVTGLAGLITTGIATYFAVKNFITSCKTKSKNELWAMVMSLADAAMKEAEASGKNGADKKQIVIDAVKAGCTDAGLDITNFIDQLNAYIDQTITFVNDMCKKK